jgi:hypothetical protein
MDFHHGRKEPGENASTRSKINAKCWMIRKKREKELRCAVLISPDHAWHGDD